MLLMSSCAFADERTGADSREIPLDIFDFVKRPEPDYAWNLAEKLDIGGSRIYRLELTSQKWQDIVWKHALVVYEPAELKHKEHMLLFVTGGSSGNVPQGKDMGMGLLMANYCGARVATLHQVPNQPLMNGRKEDDLITETWLKYLETGDSTWPLLFPMVKSAVKAMDSLEEFSVKQFNQPLQGFVISGASKRGWTSWLTSAVDPRIVATAPIVIDVLNFPAQMQHQKKTWGFYSEQIADYTSKGLVHEDGIPKQGPESHLWKMMDPYSYRSRLTMPKLLIVGANDRYWSVDAMNLYWSDLLGQKHIHRAPNAGHGLDDGRDQALRTLGVFFRHSVAGKELPVLTWEPQIVDNRVGLSMNVSSKPESASLWVATSDSNDFRQSRWESKPLTGNGEKFSGHAIRNNSERVAVFGEAQYEYEGLQYSLSTLVFWK